MRIGILVGAATLMLTVAAQAQTWPDLHMTTGRQGGGEQDAALIVGVSDYLILQDIEGATDNAVAWQEWLTRSRSLESANVVTLLDRAATKEKIERNLESLLGSIGPGGTLWFIFIGHGAPSPTGDDGLLLGVDTDADSDSLSARGVPQQRILQALGQRKSVLVFDACFSGRTSDGKLPLVKGIQATLPTRRNSSSSTTTVLSASDSFAGPLPRAARPAFSYLILGALRGWGDRNEDGKVTSEEAFTFSHDTLRAALKGSDRLPTHRGPTVVLAQDSREAAPDFDAILAGRCPAATYWDGKSCVTQAPISCPPGSTWNGTSCIALCPAGTRWDGRVCIAQTVVCPPGTSWDGSNCAAKSDNLRPPKKLPPASRRPASYEECRAAGGQWVLFVNQCKLDNN
jgi:hypothetical protein